MNRLSLEAYGVWVALSQDFVQLLAGLSTSKHIYNKRIHNYPALTLVWTKHNASNRIKEYVQKHITDALCPRPPELLCSDVWGRYSSVHEESNFLGCGTAAGRVTPNISRDHSSFISRVTQSNTKHCLTLKMKALPAIKTPRTTCPVTQQYNSHNTAFWVLSKCLLPSGPTSSSCSTPVCCYYTCVVANKS